MNTEFKVGDRVLCTDNGKYGNITHVDTSQVGEWGSTWYEVIFDDGEEAYLEEEYLELTDVDKKTAFLTELKELMEKYQVDSIYDRGMYDIEGLDISFKDGSRISYKQEIITPSNIFDYDK